MNKYLAIMICTLALVVPSVSCTAPAPQVRTTPSIATTVEPAVIKPEIKTITGETEWAPSSEGPLGSLDNDTEAGKLSYIWSAEKGTIKGEGKQVIWIAPDAVGEYKVTATATNSRGDKDVFSRTFSVLQNPYGRHAQDTTIYLKLAIPSNQTRAESSRIRAMTIADIQCTVSGSDAKELTYAWKTMGGKLMGDSIQDGKADRVGWLAPGTQGQFAVTVIVSDKNGHSAKGQVDFDVYLMN